MRVVSDLLDKRINSRNLLVELSIDEYLKLAIDIINKNPFQRRRVRSSRTVYSLLRADMERGCIIPPIVLALTSHPGEQILSKYDDFENFLQQNKEHLLILDGLQRTYTMIDLINGIKESGDEDKLNLVNSNTIRAEFYIGLNRLGILYRMLTLNTGQSPMSLRQQIEMLYLDYTTAPVGIIELIREADVRRVININQYNFRDVVEGFNSYLDRDELPIERTDLLENIRSLEKLAKENQATDLFVGYLKSWHAFISKMHEICGDAEVSDEFQEETGTPFGINVVQVFKKPQAMSGFGAAIGKLIDFSVITDGFEEVEIIVRNIQIIDPIEFLESINRSLFWIKGNTKKIGNAQRTFFHYFFRGIFNREDDCYQKPLIAAETSLRKYQSQNL